MNNSKKRFWRGFTWKRFARNTIFVFVISLVIHTIFNYFDTTATVISLFTWKAMLKKLALSVSWGFITAIWHEPDVDDDKAVPPVIV
jgi:hypothetical protein